MSETAQRAVAASHIFDGAVLHVDAAVVIEGEQIRALLPRADLKMNIPRPQQIRCAV